MKKEKLLLDSELFNLNRVWRKTILNGTNRIKDTWEWFNTYDKYLSFKQKMLEFKQKNIERLFWIDDIVKWIFSSKDNMNWENPSNKIIEKLIDKIWNK
jgi:hypothetical protein